LTRKTALKGESETKAKATVFSSNREQKALLSELNNVLGSIRLKDEIHEVMEEASHLKIRGRGEKAENFRGKEEKTVRLRRSEGGSKNLLFIFIQRQLNI